VSHGASWIAAAEAAERLEVPLHLICHDEWVRFPGALELGLDRENLFGRIYRSASSRLCVSPFMAENYQRRFGASSYVLYPSRTKDAQIRAFRSPTVQRHGTGLVYAFAGSISSSGTVRALARLAQALQPYKGELHVFGPDDAAAVMATGLDQANVRFRGLLPSAQLIDTLHSEADVLFAPMSFNLSDRANMELSFPSKLTDYTLADLPLLISGPDYCSAVQWARKHQGVAEYVTDFEGADFAEALKRLADPAHRRSIAEKAMEVGEALFSHERAFAILQLAIKGPANYPPKRGGYVG
jgi:hypothetical protein